MHDYSSSRTINQNSSEISCASEIRLLFQFYLQYIESQTKLGSNARSLFLSQTPQCLTHIPTLHLRNQMVCTDNNTSWTSRNVCLSEDVLVIHKASGCRHPWWTIIWVWLQNGYRRLVLAIFSSNSIKPMVIVKETYNWMIGSCVSYNNKHN